MLLSGERRLLFIHVQRTGGTSITVALKGNVADLIKFRGTHDHAVWARPHVADWDRLFKAAFVRNPWDRLVSWWSLIQHDTHYSNRFWEYLRSRARTFDDFVLHCTDVIEDADGIKSVGFDQLAYIADEHGSIVVDFVGRYEDLEADAARLFAHIGLPGVQLDHRNSSPHRHYSTYFSDRTREAVADRHRRDIEAFGYRFDSP